MNDAQYSSVTVATWSDERTTGMAYRLRAFKGHRRFRTASCLFPPGPLSFLVSCDGHDLPFNPSGSSRCYSSRHTNSRTPQVVGRFKSGSPVPPAEDILWSRPLPCGSIRDSLVPMRPCRSEGIDGPSAQVSGERHVHGWCQGSTLYTIKIL